MRIISITILFSFFLIRCFGQTIYQKDFLFYWQTINDNFAYFDKQRTNWNKVKTIYQPAVDTIKNTNDFVHLLEAVNNELYNGHVFLNTNTNASNRTIPSGSDLKVSRVNNKYVITEIREGFNAELSGLKTGIIVIKYNDIPVEKAVKKILPQSVMAFDKEMYEYAANMLLAGTHDTKRKITVQAGTRQQDFYPDTIPNKTDENFTSLLETKIHSNNIGYIKINNSLGNSDLIRAFDIALDNMMGTNSLILDLRETPGGGNTTVARGIMGRFIDKELPYQKHIYTAEEKETGIKRTTLEIVSPRQKIYKKPLVILVGYWTGSMGEGIAIGFDGMKRAKIVGTKMAGLLGEIYTFKMPETQIPFSLPCVQLQHLNGQSREDFLPTVKVTNPKQTLQIAINLLTKSKNKVGEKF